MAKRKKNAIRRRKHNPDPLMIGVGVVVAAAAIYGGYKLLTRRKEIVPQIIRDTPVPEPEKPSGKWIINHTQGTRSVDGATYSAEIFAYAPSKDLDHAYGFSGHIGPPVETSSSSSGLTLEEAQDEYLYFVNHINSYQA